MCGLFSCTSKRAPGTARWPGQRQEAASIPVEARRVQGYAAKLGPDSEVEAGLGEVVEAGLERLLGRLATYGSEYGTTDLDIGSELAAATPEVLTPHCPAKQGKDPALIAARGLVLSGRKLRRIGTTGNTGAEFVTRFAGGVGINPGGGVEVVVHPGWVRMRSFHDLSLKRG